MAATRPARSIVELQDRRILTTANAQPFGIASNPVDGYVWFTEWAANKVGRISPTTKKMDEYPYRPRKPSPS